MDFSNEVYPNKSSSLSAVETCAKLARCSLDHECSQNLHEETVAQGPHTMAYLYCH